jgi:hypothetical protein
LLLTIDRFTFSDDATLTVADPAPPGPVDPLRVAVAVAVPPVAVEGVTVSTAVLDAPGARLRLAWLNDPDQPEGIVRERLKVVDAQPVVLSLLRTVTFSETGLPVTVVTLLGATVTVGAAAVHCAGAVALTVEEADPPGPLEFVRDAVVVTAPEPVEDGVTESVVEPVAPGATLRLPAPNEAGHPFGVVADSANVVAEHPPASLFRTLTVSDTVEPVWVETLAGDVVTVGAAALHGSPGKLISTNAPESFADTVRIARSIVASV